MFIFSIKHFFENLSRYINFRMLIIKSHGIWNYQPYNFSACAEVCISVVFQIQWSWRHSILLPFPAKIFNILYLYNGIWRINMLLINIILNILFGYDIDAYVWRVENCTRKNWNNDHFLRLHSHWAKSKYLVGFC